MQLKTNKLKQPFFTKLVLAVLSVMCCALAASAQNVKGKITDDENLGMPGVSISLKGTATVALSDSLGNYSINIPAGNGNPVLVFSMLGFQRQEIIVNQRTLLNIKLVREINDLSEVVVIGYGTVAKRDLTGAVDKADIKEMQKASVLGFDQSLAGRVAGVNVVSGEGRPGAEADIVIRGANSLTQNNNPLYVIDGFPVETSMSNAIDPKDIESIEILKDASATAIYGARGANGVVMITTKTGKDAKPTISYDGFYGVQSVLKKMEMMDGYEFVKLQGEVFGTQTMEDYYFFGGRTLESYRGTGKDFQDDMFRTAPMQKHGLSILSGNAGTKYNLSFSYTGQDGVVLNTGFDRVQGRFSLDQDVRKWLKLGAKLTYSRSKYSGTFLSDGTATYNIMQNTWAYRPVTGSSNFDLENDLFDPILNSNDNYRINPVVAVKNEQNDNVFTFMMANGYVDVNILRNLKFRTIVGYSKNNIRNDIFNNSKSRSGNPLTTTLGVNAGQMYDEKSNWLNENTLTYNLKKRKHAFEAMGGFSLQYEDHLYNYTRMQQIPYETLGMSGMDQGSFYSMNTYRNDWTLMSYYSRINYNYAGKYYFTGTMRADGSSKFSPQNRWGYFPSASLMWRFSSEKFMKSFKFVDDAKLRLSWGTTGNNRVGEYASLPQITALRPDRYYFGGELIIGSAKTVMGNPELKWESTVMTNIGLDLSMLKKRLNLTVEVYQKRTKDLLLNAQLPGSSGYLSSFKNIGEVENRGLEITLNTINMKKRDFMWTSSFNIAFNRNKVISLTENQETLATSVWWEYSRDTQPAYIARKGEPVGLMFGFVYDGTYKPSEFTQTGSTYYLKDNIAYPGSRANVRPGDMKYRDINGDGIIDANDRTVIGNGFPLHTGGLNNTFSYKNFDLSVFFQWSYGNDILNANKYMFERYYMPHSNMYASYANRWTPENPNSNIPRVNEGSGSYYSSYGIEDGSYLRLKTVALGYNLPAKLLGKSFVQSLRMYVSAQNLWTWTNYTGMDPEVSTRPGALTPGFDFSAYPRSNTITFGLNMNLK
ncbi:SusC/RagA family TonB-linked outer membrane protein [Pedobacter nanyangensis]|uniref:SusC/RagA family TonB-linked outer membrane protein n=1 Tax=Pedobacter nanyangensis TaxID=1562389 RepID=UPI0019642601|nr:TonB-dependent receptor [Pedobacter nanyangensis]